MSAIYGLYDTPEAAQRAVDGLRAVGIGARQITIISSEPLEGYEMGQRDHHTRMPWIAFAGGLTGFVAGVALTSLTQLAWPLVTGGMPIVSIWPNMIPIFELTMLGAVLATVATFVVTALLPGNRSKIYDPAVSDGKILVGVEGQQDVSDAMLEGALEPDGEIRHLP